MAWRKLNLINLNHLILFELLDCALDHFYNMRPRAVVKQYGLILLLWSFQLNCFIYVVKQLIAPCWPHSFQLSPDAIYSSGTTKHKSFFFGESRFGARNIACIHVLLADGQNFERQSRSVFTSFSLFSSWSIPVPNFLGSLIEWRWLGTVHCCLFFGKFTIYLVTFAKQTPILLSCQEVPKIKRDVIFT